MPNPGRPHLSYVLAAATDDEMHKAAAWLRQATLSPDVEVVLAAPAPVFGRMSARVIPAGVTTASADPGADRKAIRVAGARRTSGLIVIAVDCDGDVASRMQHPLDERSEDDGTDPADWSRVELPRGAVRQRR